MPTERELLALCLKWLRNPRKMGAFDRAMLIEAVQAKLEPRPWVGLTDEERFEVADISDCFEDVVAAVEAKLKEKNQ
jgi:hypothetical protein